ncbi:MAG TPA: nucleotidyltransferase domain-containing protein [Dehalococcoidia bacterium]|nr:nucleotidyltransferase domain-containing protein [Dehalococcoidia bacterium]
MEPSLATEIPRLLAADPRVLSVELTGSRARGDPGPLSDWDFALVSNDASGVCRRLPSLLSPLKPIALVPDPLARHVVVAPILPGPVKVDLIFDEEHAPEPPWVPGGQNLISIDAHFWDWTLWLAGKQLKGNERLVQRELSLMHQHLLAPLGVAAAPDSLGEAVLAYIERRTAWEMREGVVVPRELEDAVRGALVRHRLI